MQISVRLGLAVLLGLGLTGCAARTAKAPSYDDRELRPLNQDLAAWLARLNVQPPVAAEPAIAVGAPVSSQAIAQVTRAEPSPPTEALTNLNAPSPKLANGVNDLTPQASQFLQAAAPVAPATRATAMPPVAVAAVTSSPDSPPPPASPLPPPLTLTATATTIEAPKPAAAPEPELPTWTALPGDSLRDAVQIWSQREGWQVEWDAQIDYDIVAALTYRGTYLEAIRGIFKAHAGAERPLLVDLYPTQKLIYVTE